MRTWLHRSGLVTLAVAAILSFSIAAPAASGRANVMQEHSRIAVEALKAGGATEAEARAIVAISLSTLKTQGVRVPTRIPWNN